MVWVDADARGGVDGVTGVVSSGVTGVLFFVVPFAAVTEWRRVKQNAVPAQEIAGSADQTAPSALARLVLQVRSAASEEPSPCHQRPRGASESQINP